MLNATTEMIADGFTEGNEGSQELRYLCDLLFKKLVSRKVAKAQRFWKMLPGGYAT
jgi:hypothetical protein